MGLEDVPVDFIGKERSGRKDRPGKGEICDTKGFGDMIVLYCSNCIGKPKLPEENTFLTLRMQQEESSLVLPLSVAVQSTELR